MSHLVTVQAKIRDPGAISAACAGMSLAAPVVGQSEANLRQALRIADAMSPSILFCDEVRRVG